MIPITNVLYWFGVVEDINDPEMLDRVRVRVYGAHSANKSIQDIDGTPTEHLMWMNTIMPVTSAQFSGVGQRHGLLPGSTVFGMYLDPECQTGIVIGSMQTKNSSRDPIKGFSDPSGQYPNGLYTGGMTSVPMRGTGIIDDQEESRQTIAGGVGYPIGEDSENIQGAGDVTISMITMADEGFQAKPYKDPHDVPKGLQVGFGHYLGNGFDLYKAYKKLQTDLGKQLAVGQQITLEDAKILLKSQLEREKAAMLSVPQLELVYNQLDEVRKIMFWSLQYQMGPGTLKKFTKALDAMKAKDWKTVAFELKNSIWAKQQGDRTNRVIATFLDGNFEKYKPYLSEKLARMGIKIENPGRPQKQKEIAQQNTKWIDFTSTDFALGIAKKAKGSGYCAKRVADALQYAGYPIERGHARDWNDGRLQKCGFNPISKQNYSPKKGDIVVFKPHGKDQSGGIYGHVQYFNGSKWVQDFGTNDFFTNNKYAQMGENGYTIYRHPGAGA